MWKDWLNAALGAWMAVSPWLLGLDGATEPNVVYNCLLSGALIAGFAVRAAYGREPWQQWTVIFLGFWLLIAPGTWSYQSIVMTWNNVLVGLAIVIMATARLGDLSAKAKQ